MKNKKSKKQKYLIKENTVTYSAKNKSINNFINQVIESDCIELMKNIPGQSVDLTFLDPPFNQDKEYNSWNDNLPEQEYWQIMEQVCKNIYKITSNGGAIYFMQREKNTEYILQCLRKAEWVLQNLIIWKKKSSAVPCLNKFGKHYQIIAFATKGKKPRVFNRLRINPPLPPVYKYERENGMYITDIWDDIRELTSGYFAGDEAIRKENGERFHKQQSPVALLLRIILSSTKIGDIVLDPFAGTGTTLIVAKQLGRKYIGIEIDSENIRCINNRLEHISREDSVIRFYKDYIYTKNLKTVWDVDFAPIVGKKEKVLELFRE
ncbi:MAG: DNA methyltransferase [Elusimicrobiota bacterium]